MVLDGEQLQSVPLPITEKHEVLTYNALLRLSDFYKGGFYTSFLN